MHWEIDQLTPALISPITDDLRFVVDGDGQDYQACICLTKTTIAENDKGEIFHTKWPIKTETLLQGASLIECLQACEDSRCKMLRDARHSRVDPYNCPVCGINAKDDPAHMCCQECARICGVKANDL